MTRTQVNEKQVNFRQIFSPIKLLQSRGFIPTQLEIHEARLKNAIDEPEGEIARELYAEMNDPVSRTKAFEESRTTEAASAEYSKMFEWYVGELMVQEFSSFSFCNNISLYKQGESKKDLGDYDTVIVVRDLSFIYFECKSNTFQYDDILKAIRRAQFIHSDATIIAYGKDLPEDELKCRVVEAGKKGFPGLDTNPAFHKLSDCSENRNASIYGWYNCYFIRIDEMVRQNLQLTLKLISIRKNFLPYHGVDVSDHEYKNIGIVVQSC